MIIYHQKQGNTINLFRMPAPFPKSRDLLLGKDKLGRGINFQLLLSGSNSAGGKSLAVKVTK